MTHYTSVAIMAHPSRERMVEKLVERLDCALTVVWDDKQDRIDTGVRALRSMTPGATHHTVIQDDAIVPKYLVIGINRILDSPTFRKDVPLCLYAGNVGYFAGKFQQAFRRRPYSWITMTGLNWGVGVTIPALDIEPLTNFMLARSEPQYDLRMSRYFERRKVPVWYPIPSLIDHDPGPSLIEGHGHSRRAWRFIGEHNSALNFDMELGAVHLPLTRRHIG